MLDAYVFIIFVSSSYWSLDHYVVTLSLIMVFILKSVCLIWALLFPAFFWFPFAWNIFSHRPTLSLYVSLSLVKAMVFPVVMYGCEGWTIRKAEHKNIDAFELWCWRRLLRVPWTARRSNQSILKAISPEYSLEGLMLKLKVQYFGLLIGRADSFEKTLMLGKIDGRRRRG